VFRFGSDVPRVWGAVGATFDARIEWTGLWRFGALDIGSGHGGAAGQSSRGTCAPWYV